MKEKVLITGGAGYIGSILTSFLLAKGFQVTVIDNFFYKQNSLLNSIGHPNFQLIQGDVCNRQLLREVVAKADILIPLAAIVGAPACDKNPVISKAINVDAIHYLLQESSSSQIILYPNTNSGYGIGEIDTYCTEDSPLRPISLYGKQKVQSEETLLASNRAVAFRLATVFGISPRMRLDLLVNDFTFKALQDRYLILFEEHFKRNYIHVKDVASAFLFGIENFSKMRGEAFNVGLSTANLSKKELANKIKKHIPHLFIHGASIGEDPDKRNYIVSNKKIENLGWKASFSLDDGIQEIITAYPMLRNSPYANV